MRGIRVFGLAMLISGCLQAADVAIGRLQLTNRNGYQALTFYNLTGVGNGGCDGALYKVCNGVTIRNWTLTLTYANAGNSNPTNAPPASPLVFTSGGSDAIAPYSGSGPGYIGSQSGTWEIPFSGVGGTEPACPPCDYQLTKVEFAGAIDPATIPFSVGSPGSMSQFGANPNFRATWNIQTTDPVQPGYVNYNDPQFFGGQYDVVATDQQLTVTYLVGDIAPSTTDVAPDFGDHAMNILDLVQVLFAVNNVAGFQPAACSDRFDAMDLYPVDTGSMRGGDGILDIRDLIRELFRVNNLDTDRPERATRGGVCASGGTSSGLTSLGSRRNSAAARPGASEAEGVLTLGRPEKAAAGEERVPVYLEAKRELVRVAVTLALGDQSSQLRFLPAGTPPSLLQEGQVGVIALAWLDGLSVRAGQRLLLGYVAGPAGVAAKLKVYGLSASGLDDDREVRLNAPVVEPLR